MKKFLVSIIMFFSIFITVVFGNENQIFTYLDIDNVDPKTLEEFRNFPGLGETVIPSYAQISINALFENKYLSLELPNQNYFEFERIQIEGGNQANNFWIGRELEGLGNITLLESNGIISGKIYSDSGTYSIRYLDNQTYVILSHQFNTIDQDIEVSQNDTFFIPQEDSHFVNKNDDTPTIFTDNPINTRIHFYYTQDAKAEFESIYRRNLEDGILIDVENTNLALQNSLNYDTRFEIAGMTEIENFEIQYADPLLDHDLYVSETLRLTMDDFRYNNPFQEIRNYTAADIQVLIIDNWTEDFGYENGATCGYTIFTQAPWLSEGAHHNLAREATIIVDSMCIAEELNLVIPHEIGHIYGGGHGGENNSFGSSTYKNGFCNIEEGWTTIMASQSEYCRNGISGPVFPILYYSTPDVTHPVTGSVLGTREYNHVAKAFRTSENGKYVANYRRGIGTSPIYTYQSGNVLKFTGSKDLPWYDLGYVGGLTDIKSTYINYFGEYLIGLNGTGAIVKYSSSTVPTGNWNFYSYASNPDQIELSSRGNIYLLKNDGSILMDQNSHQDNIPNWRTIDSDSSNVKIAVSKNPHSIIDNVFVLKNNDTIWKLTNTISPSWELIGNRSNVLDIKSSNNEFFVLQNDGHVYRYEGTPFNWNDTGNDGSSWGTTNSSNAKEIIFNSERIYKINNDNSIWTYDDVTSNYWIPLGYVNPTDRMFSEATSSLVKINNTGKILRKSNIHSSWEEILNSSGIDFIRTGSR